MNPWTRQWGGPEVTFLQQMACLAMACIGEHPLSCLNHEKRGRTNRLDSKPSYPLTSEGLGSASSIPAPHQASQARTTVGKSDTQLQTSLHISPALLVIPPSKESTMGSRESTQGRRPRGRPTKFGSLKFVEKYLAGVVDWPSDEGLPKEPLPGPDGSRVFPEELRTQVPKEPRSKRATTPGEMAREVRHIMEAEIKLPARQTANEWHRMSLQQTRTVSPLNLSIPRPNSSSDSEPELELVDEEPSDLSLLAPRTRWRDTIAGPSHYLRPSTPR